MPRSDEKKTTPAPILAETPNGDALQPDPPEKQTPNHEQTDPGLEAIPPTYEAQGEPLASDEEPSLVGPKTDPPHHRPSPPTIEQMAWNPSSVPSSDGATELLSNPLSPDLLAFLSAEEQAALAQVSSSLDPETSTGEFDAAPDPLTTEAARFEPPELQADPPQEPQEWAESATPSTDPNLVAVPEESIEPSVSTDPTLAAVSAEEDELPSYPGIDPPNSPPPASGLPPPEQPFSQDELEASQQQSLVDEISYKSQSDTFSDMPQFNEQRYKEELQKAEKAALERSADPALANAEREKPT